MSNGVSLGSYAFKKFGPEKVTLYQLSQAEDDGLWPPNDGPTCSALVSCLVTARRKIKVVPLSSSNLTQMGHTYKLHNQ